MEKNVVIELSEVILSDQKREKSFEIKGENPVKKLENLAEAILVVEEILKTQTPQ